MRFPARVRTFLLILTGWAAVNGLLYLGIAWIENFSYFGRHRVTWQTINAYSGSAFRLDTVGGKPSILLPNRLMSPLNANSGKRFPLVVFLHGAGARGSDNQRQLSGFPEQMANPSWRKRFPCFLLAPQCAESTSWVDLDAELLNLIRTAMGQFPIDPHRVYLTGLSMGGYGSWKLAAVEPELFAAVVPICGGGEPAWASQVAQVPIWAVHGDADYTVPVEESRTMIQAIREAGGNPNYTELKGVGHNSWTQTYRDPEGVVNWMFQQTKP